MVRESGAAVLSCGVRFFRERLCVPFESRSVVMVVEWAAGCEGCIVGLRNGSCDGEVASASCGMVPQEALARRSTVLATVRVVQTQKPRVGVLHDCRGNRRNWKVNGGRIV